MDDSGQYKPATRMKRSKLSLLCPLCPLGPLGPLSPFSFFLIPPTDIKRLKTATRVIMKGFCPLASGSKGNCIYLGTEQTKILIDAGLSAKAIIAKLAQINVDIAEIDAILVTHEHSDHIQGLKVLAFKYGIPVFCNTETAKGIVDYLHECPKFKIFTTGETFEFGDLEIHPFTIQHDTLDPVAFTIRTGSLKMGFCTDLGFVTSLVANHLQECDYLYVEANHQPSMVHACARPMM